MSRGRIASLVVLAAAVLWAVAPPPAPRGAGFDARGFGELPVVHDGRLKPLDTAARASLLLISGRQTLRDGGRELSAVEWLLDATADPAKADRYPIFTIDHPDLLGLADLRAAPGRRYSYAELAKSHKLVDEQAQAALAADPDRRTAFQQAALNLAERLDLYWRLKNTLWPEGQGAMSARLEALSAAAKAGEGGEPPILRMIVGAAVFRPVPGADCSPEGFADVGSAGLALMSGRREYSGVTALARLRDAASAGDAASFDAALAAYRGRLAAACPAQTAWAARESLFNRLEPFYRGMILYLISLLALLAGRLFAKPDLEALAARLAALAFLVHTGGLVFRTLLQGRPPVTNLYSSAVFVGWAAVAAGLLLARLYRSGLAVLGADVIGFATLIVAHHLAVQGDTVEMMRAVLDSNFWLTTHVVTITLGYGAGLLASVLGHAALAGRLKGRADGAEGPLLDMIYALLCAGLVLSFVGTVLGGIWADQSWGRFWGWDPKENGALLIVLWNAMALHGRWAGMIRERGLILMAISGGVITALAWFGVNMLGVGLHSYGFSSGGFYALTAFVGVESVVLAWAAWALAPERRAPEGPAAAL